MKTLATTLSNVFSCGKKKALIINEYLKTFMVGMRDDKKSIDKVKGKKHPERSSDESEPCVLKNGTYVGKISRELLLLGVSDDQSKLWEEHCCCERG